MRYLIAQGPAYYGVNMRHLTDEQAEKVEAEMLKWSSVEKTANGEVRINSENNTTIVLTAPGMDGFDTGWWDEGEQVLARLLHGIV